MQNLPVKTVRHRVLQMIRTMTANKTDLIHHCQYDPDDQKSIQNIKNVSFVLLNSIRVTMFIGMIQYHFTYILFIEYYICDLKNRFI